MWGGDVGGIYGESHDDSSWGGGRGATELENPGHGGRSTYISNGLPGQGVPAELPSRGMPGTSGDEEVDAGTLPAPSCPGHSGHSGGGKPPPSTVQPIQHDGPPTGPKQQAPCHSSVRQGSGAEEAAASGGGAWGELVEGLQGIWGADGECNGVSVTGTGVDGGIR